MKKKAGRNTLLMSVVMSAPGPLVVGLGLFMGKSTTQLADFFRRTAELLAIIASFIVYSLTNRDGVEDRKRKERLEHLTNRFVGAMMLVAGISMILVTILSENSDKGNVIPGLSIAIMGVIANTIFWFRYTKLWKLENNQILRVQSRLYRAKSLVDICVTTALTIVAIFPDSVAAVYFDAIGSIIVAAYLAWCGIKTMKESKTELEVKEEFMEYRKLPGSGERISIIGIGTSYVGETGEDTVIKTVRRGLDAGINLIDMAGGHSAIFSGVGKALEGQREKAFLQVHFGATFKTGEYGWTLDLEEIKESISWQLKELGTDYIDFGYIHCIDDSNDLKKYKENGVLDYVLKLKEEGVIRHLGFSTHAPALANEVLDMGIIDILMFSINPSYDYHHGEYGIGSADERQALYRRCEKEGVGIVVMKPFCGGQLLDKESSPFNEAMTKNQCLQYALDKPAVVTVVPGYANPEELDAVLEFFSASDEEKDYSVIGSFTPDDSKGKCVYCRHCHPCPAGLDVALINKYYDLALQGDGMAEEHYRNLDKKAEDCVDCGHCDHRCPFHVSQSQRMKEIASYFNK